MLMRPTWPLQSDATAWEDDAVAAERHVKDGKTQDITWELPDFSENVTKATQNIFAVLGRDLPLAAAAPCAAALRNVSPSLIAISLVPPPVSPTIGDMISSFPKRALAMALLAFVAI